MSTIGNFFKDIITDNSNRGKHFAGGIICGFCLTILFALGVAFGMEFKDRHKGGKWDWKDFLATVFGGVIGNLLLAAWIYAIIH